MAKVQAEKISMKALRSLVKEALIELHTEAETGKKVTNTDADIAVKAVSSVVASVLKGGSHVGLPELGTLELRERGARKGRNPQTGEELEISARKTIGFKPAGELKESVKAL